MNDIAVPTAPPVARAPMRAHPWFGLRRGLLFALLPGLQFRRGDGIPPAWLDAAQRRRRVLLALVAILAAAAWTLTPPDTPLPQAVLQTLLFAWVSAGLATALMGGWVTLRGDTHSLRLRPARGPIDPRARTALVMPICNEDIATVFAGLRATCESLAATGALALFDVYVLSDTADPQLRAAELHAWQQLRAQLGDGAVAEGGRVFYRWRRRRTRRKAGNVADFCRRWGRHYRYMVVLDADSAMSGDALVSLVRLMEQHPHAGIVQTLPLARGAATLHARLQQFASLVTGRLFALGMAYWQLGESHYWGHNAILRVEPFMQHCALAPIRGRGGLSGEILSHDFVEAAMMRRAGYEVWLAPDLAGSWEQHPPHLLAELQRDRRWCQGNLQNARLIAEPGWRPAHRAMFATGALSYAVAPLWLGFVALGLTLHPEGPTQGSLALWLFTAALLLLPRVLGVGAVLWAGEQGHYGGAARLLASACIEMLLSAVQAPLRMLAHSTFVLGALTGLRLEWKSPPRDAAGVRWRDAFERIGMLALAALGGVLALWQGEVAQTWYLAPLLLPLLLAVPFTVLTGSVTVGGWVRRLGLLLTPEERRPPRPLRSVAEAERGFAHLAARSSASPPGAAATALPFATRRRSALALGTAALAALALAPRPGITPGVSPALQAERQLAAMLQASPTPAAPAATPTLRRTAAALPARRIDDSVRQRASAAVERAIAEENYERLIWSLAKAAANAP